jgi:excisionase family DNA binding protein
MNDERDSQATPLDQLFTVQEVAYRLGISEAAARQRIRRGQIPCVKMGRSLRIKESQLEALIDALPKAGHDVPFHQKGAEYFMRPSDVDAWMKQQGREWEYVYILKCGPYYKIGKTNHLSRRLAELEIQLPHKPKLIHSLRTPDSRKTEAELHHMFRDQRLNGEWFGLKKIDVLNLRLITVHPDGSINHAGSHRLREASAGPHTHGTHPGDDDARQSDFFT